MSPQHYPIDPGLLYGGEYPGDWDPDFAEARLRQLIAIGIRTFVDLTERDDEMEPYVEMLGELERNMGVSLSRLSMPIPDVGIPQSKENMRSILSAIRTGIQQSPAVYIHCWGGIGRTGTVVGCWFRECGLGPDAALERVQQLYSAHMPKAKFREHRYSPETQEQMDYVRHWQPEHH
ncbi:MAG: fused DSP-PTPase phosphatase/NAD kinase-like protein [Verrucomicrobiota bacterium]